MKSAGIIPIHIFEDGMKILMLRNGTHWDFPKGVVENNEDEKTAAIRELKEETGIENPQFIFGEDFYETESYGRKNKIARYYIATVSISEVFLPINKEIGKPEHEEFRWLAFNQIKELDIKQRILKAIIWAFDHIHNKWKG